MQSSSNIGVDIDSDPALYHQSPMGMDNRMLHEVEERNVQRRTRWTRAAVGLVLAMSLLFVIVDSFGDQMVEAAILNFLEWVQEHPFEGVLAVICVYIVATILFVPGSILTLGTGYAFGRACDSTAFGVLLASTVRTTYILLYPSWAIESQPFISIRLSLSGLPLDPYYHLS
jgi:hypothetical protein